MWYGIPTIATRFLGYLMNMALPFLFKQPADTADIVQVYTMIPFLNVLFTYGLETAYFRYSRQHDRERLYNTLSVSIAISTIVLTLLLLLSRGAIAGAASLTEHPEYIVWMAWIVLIDTLTTLPFARLRQENRPRRYAFVRVAGIVMNVLVVILFMGILPGYLQKHPGSIFAKLYNPHTGIGYYLIGNICGSVFTLLLLWKEIRNIRLVFDKALWKEVMKYSYPLVIVGMGGIVNDMLSRLIYQHVVDLPVQQAKEELGIFANIYRLAVLITVMIQAFRMAAEPFFFRQSEQEGAQRTYARVMKFFVLACCFMLLGIGLFLDVFYWIFAKFSPRYTEGLYIVPLLALGNVFLGIYYNLSVWYKLTNKNVYGAYITFAGVVITIVLNIILIPVLHYAGAAIATFCCYLAMMIMSYKLGQKYYPVPYARKKLTAYIVLVILLYFIHLGITRLLPGRLWFSVASGMFLFGFFAWFVGKIEAREFARLPLIGRYFKK